MKEYDLVVVGSGVGLSVLSEGMNAGLNCALIEEGKMGGTCLTRGCIPSKVLVYPADIIREAQRAKKVGIEMNIGKIDWNLITHRMWSQIDESKQIDKGLTSAPNLKLYKGTGEFVADYQMRVNKSDGSGWSETFQGKKIVLASGAQSLIPPIPGLDKIDYITSENFFGDKFPKKPWKSLIIIGGGIIAAEFAHIFSAFGTEVTIIEMLPRIVSTEEPEISAQLERVFRKTMNVYTSMKAVGFRKEKELKVVTIEYANTGKKQDLAAEEILIAVGRRSNADILKVEKSGIRTDPKGWITVNEYLETSKPNIWAIGDATGQYQFRHKANYDAELVTKNIFGNPAEKTAVDYSAVPWAIFTHPQIAHVGLTEKEAIDKGHEIFVAQKTYSSVAKGFAMGYAKNDEDDGFFKLIVGRNYRILGAHAIGPEASVLVQPFVYLMNAGYTCMMPPESPLKSLPKTAFACPEAGSFMPIYRSMVIHPSLNEVTGWAVGNLRPVNIKMDEQKHHHNHSN